MLQETKYHRINQVCKDGQFVRSENTPLPGGDTVYSLIGGENTSWSGVKILPRRGWEYFLVVGENTPSLRVRILPRRGWEYSLVGGENTLLSEVRIVPHRGWEYFTIGGDQGLIEPPKAARVLSDLEHIYSIEMELKSDYGVCLWINLLALWIL